MNAGCVNTVVACWVLITSDYIWLHLNTSDYISQVAKRKLTAHARPEKGINFVRTNGYKSGPLKWYRQEMRNCYTNSGLTCVTHASTWTNAILLPLGPDKAARNIYCWILSCQKYLLLNTDHLMWYWQHTYSVAVLQGGGTEGGVHPTKAPGEGGGEGGSGLAWRWVPAGAILCLVLFPDCIFHK